MSPGRGGRRSLPANWRWPAHPAVPGRVLGEPPADRLQRDGLASPVELEHHVAAVAGGRGEGRLVARRGETLAHRNSPGSGVVGHATFTIVMDSTFTPGVAG